MHVFLCGGHKLDPLDKHYIKFIDKREGLYSVKVNIAFYFYLFRL